MTSCIPLIQSVNCVAVLKKDLFFLLLHERVNVPLHEEILSGPIIHILYNKRNNNSIAQLYLNNWSRLTFRD